MPLSNTNQPYQFFDPSPGKVRRDILLSCVTLTCSFCALGLHRRLGALLSVVGALILALAALTLFAVAQARLIEPIDPAMLANLRIAPYIYLALAARRVWRFFVAKIQ